MIERCPQSLKTECVHEAYFQIHVWVPTRPHAVLVSESEKQCSYEEHGYTITAGSGLLLTSIGFQAKYIDKHVCVSGRESQTRYLNEEQCFMKLTRNGRVVEQCAGR